MRLFTVCLEESDRLGSQHNERYWTAVCSETRTVAVTCDAEREYLGTMRFIVRAYIIIFEEMMRETMRHAKPAMNYLCYD